MDAMDGKLKSGTMRYRTQVQATICESNATLPSPTLLYGLCVVNMILQKKHKTFNCFSIDYFSSRV